MDNGADFLFLLTGFSLWFDNLTILSRVEVQPLPALVTLLMPGFYVIQFMASGKYSRVQV